MNQRAVLMTIAGNAAKKKLSWLLISPVIKEQTTKARKTKKMLFKPTFESNGASIILATELLMVRVVLILLKLHNLFWDYILWQLCGFLYINVANSLFRKPKWATQVALSNLRSKWFETDMANTWKFSSLEYITTVEILLYVCVEEREAMVIWSLDNWLA